MIISHSLKKIIYFVPRTGSTSFYKCLKPVLTDVYAHTHGIISNRDQEKYQDYDVYAFYRDPVERFVSSLNYSGRAHFIESNIKFINQELTPIDAIELLRESNEHKTILRHNILFTKQSHWYSHPRIIPLNFHDINNEINRVLSDFGQPTIQEIPKVNQSIKKNYKVEDLTSEDVQEIREYYSDDYDFFRGRNLSFN